MISIATARRLRDGGLRWTPEAGDRFVAADRGMDEEVFVLSDMIAEVVRFRGADIIGFNGTTEWALDAIEQRDTLWLPRESQLRERLGGTLRSLTTVPTGWQVTLEVNGTSHTFSHADGEEAYALALLYLVAGDSSTG